MGYNWPEIVGMNPHSLEDLDYLDRKHTASGNSLSWRLNMCIISSGTVSASMQPEVKRRDLYVIQGIRST